MSKESEALRKAAAYMRKNGFSPAWFESRANPDCGCFGHALRSVLPEPADIEHFMQPVREVIGCGIAEYVLRRNGWVNGCTDDAVAALLIAADLAE